MNHPIQKIASILFVVVFLIAGCVPARPEAEKQLEDQLATMVSSTLTAIPTNISAPTDTPLPAPTETVPSTPFIPSPTAIPLDLVMATPKPDYACQITRREPADDTKISRGNHFDIEWTIVNTGTQKWEKGTLLRYQTGPEMTSVKEVALPELKPGEKTDIALSATAPEERELQIMVWEVVGPGKAKGSMYWMCYPYIRIIVKK